MYLLCKNPYKNMKEIGFLYNFAKIYHNYKIFITEMGKYDIDGKSFDKVKDAQKHLRGIFRKLKICKSVKTKNKEYFEKITKIMARHQGAIRKGVIDLEGNILVQDLELKMDVRKSGTEVFHLFFITKDGVQDNISWRDCINPGEKSYATKVKIAARFSIEEQMEEFRTKNPIQKCSSDPCLYSHEGFGFHVDHVVHFQKLLEDFIKLVPTTEIKDFDASLIPGLNTFSKRFKKENDKWQNEWKQYHRANAKLQWLCRTCNLKKKKYAGSME